MKHQRKLILAKAAVVMSTIPFLVYAYEYGPDAGAAGVPDENGSCSQLGCHTGTGVNAGGGSVSVVLPQGMSYTPGVTQHLVVSIDDAKARRWGFELTARLAGDTKTMAGSFAPTDERTQLMCSSADLVRQVNAKACAANLPLAYIEHTQAGYNVTQSSPGKYEFDWTPPATDVGPVTFYVAGNASNGDLTQNGDRIYTTTYTLTAQATCDPGPPTISAVQNGAGYQNNIQQQSWVQIKGCNLSASPSRAWTASDTVGGNAPLQLDDVSATIDGRPAVISYISSTQLNVLAPADAFTGTVDVVVSNGNGTSTAFQATLQDYSPALFLCGKHAMATVGTVKAAPVGFAGSCLASAPASPGDTVTLWGTGLGPADTALAATPSITVGGVAARYVSGGLAAGVPGLYQIVIKLPANVPGGDQPVKLAIGGASIPDGAFLSIQK